MALSTDISGLPIKVNVGLTPSTADHGKEITGLFELQRDAEKGNANEAVQTLLGMTRNQIAQLDLELFNPNDMSVWALRKIENPDAFAKELARYSRGAPEKRNEHLEKMRQLLME